MINGNSGESSGASVRQKSARAASAAGQAAADSERDSYDDAMKAARAGAATEAPRPDRYDVLPTNIPSYRKGGKMKYRGVAKLHRGERAKGRKSKGR